MTVAQFSSNWQQLGTDADNPIFYRKQDVYDMDWDVGRGESGMEDWWVVGAPGGGPIALMRNPHKPVLVGKQPLGRPRILIYNSAGVLIHTIVLESTTGYGSNSSNQIIRLGWTAHESLMVLFRDGSYRLYPPSPNPAPLSSIGGYTQHNLPSQVRERGVLDAKVYDDGTGMVLLTEEGLTFWEVKGWPRSAEGEDADTTEGDGLTAEGGGMATELRTPPLTSPPLCWNLISPSVSQSRQVEVMLCTSLSEGGDVGTSNGTSSRHPMAGRVWSVDIGGCREEPAANDLSGPFASIIPSPNGRYLALLTVPSSSRPQTIHVILSDFTRHLSSQPLTDVFTLGSEGLDAGGGDEVEITWCGNEAVVLKKGGEVVLVGPDAGDLSFFYTDEVTLIGEIDGIRIISPEKCEFLQRVPNSTFRIFSPTSSDVSKTLFTASQLFDERSPKADELIRTIKDDLVLAVDTCIDAAGREFDVRWQKTLMKAASFGKTFLDQYNPTEFVNMSQTLRVLNAAREFRIGIPVTYDQYIQSSPGQLISRLTARSHHLLSLRISSFLGLSPAPVLRHWARMKIAQSKGKETEREVEDVCRNIVEMLRTEGGTLKGKGKAKAVNPANGAATSAPTLPTTQEGPAVGGDEVSCADVAKTAWMAGQTALATMLLDYEPKSSKQVPLLISMKQDNLALIKAVESGDPDLVYTVLLYLKRAHSLGNFFRFVDNKPDAAALLQVYAKEYDVELLRDFYFQDDRRTESACLALEESNVISDITEKITKLKSAAKFFGEDKDRVFEGKIVDEQLRLMAFQQSLEKEVNGSRTFVGLSVNDTIRACIEGGYPKKADKVKTDFKVPDKRFWYIKLKSLTEIRDWEGIEAFAKAKRSPIGYEPFVEHLMASGNPRQALTFVPRCEPRNRPDLYVKCGDWTKAGEECRDRNDRNKVLDLRARAPNQVIAAQLDKLIDEMGGRDGF